MPEIEAKFLLQHPEQYAATLDTLQTLGFTATPEQAEQIVDRYFDTPDWRIYRAGWAFRRRARGAEEERTLKALAPPPPRADAVFVREEIEEAGGASSAVGGELDERLRAIVDGASASELFRVATARRRRIVDRSGREPLRLELALDQSEITDEHSHHLRFAEIELELLDGPQDALTPVVERLANEVGLLPAQLSKFERGLQTAGLAVPPKRLHARPGLDEPVLALPYFLLAEQRSVLERELPRAWEGLDPEGVHSMRVAVRRSRAALAVFKRQLPPTERVALNSELKWLSGTLGLARDADIECSRIARYLQESPPEEQALLAPYLATLQARRRGARESLIAALGGSRFRELMSRLDSLSGHGASAQALRRWSDFRIREGAGLAIDAATRRVLKRGRKIEKNATAAALHELRLAAKRLRYALEFFGPYYEDRLKGPMRATKKLQDSLGDYQDADVATRHVKRYLAEHGVPETQRAALERFMGVSRHGATNAYCEFRSAWQRFRKQASRKRAKLCEPCR